jgi:hypothetical protein
MVDERRQQTIACPKGPHGHEFGTVHTDLRHDRLALSGPVDQEVIARRVAGADVAVRPDAQPRPRDLGQAEAEDVAPAGWTSWTRSAVTPSQSPTFGQSTPPLSS